MYGRAEIIRRNADAAGRRRIKRPEWENLTIFIGFLHLVWSIMVLKILESDYNADAYLFYAITEPNTINIMCASE